MNLRSRIFAFTVVAVGWLAGNAFAQITIPTTYVGDLGNPNDSTGYGAVGYGYKIGTTEVTLSQYAVFLNAVAKTDTYGLYQVNLATDLHIAGISRTGSSGSYSYSVVGNGNRPVSYVSWFDAARFVNWLENGQPTGSQNASTTERGTYTLDGATSGVNFPKKAWAQYWIPSESEWYKAAYYQPAGAGGDGDGYWLYPTRSNTQPNSRNGSASDPNSANYYYDDGLPNGFNGGYAVTGSTVLLANQNYLTPGGAFSVAGSYYGSFDQGGSVAEWLDATSGLNRVFRGGAWSGNESSLRATSRQTLLPGNAGPGIGFRIAAVPEPGATSLLLVGLALLFRRRAR